MSTIAATEFLPLVATAGATTDSMVVSLHDIAPSSQRIADEIISELTHRGVRTCSLLVVPDYHRQGLFTKDRQFVSWLRDLESDGHGVVIPGFFHQQPRRANETMRDKFLTRFYTNDEGEFYDLDYEESFRRITTARDEFRAHGLKPRGFIAPAWLLSAQRGMQNWNTLRVCELSATWARARIFLQDRLFIVFEAPGGEPGAAPGMR